MRRFKPHYSLKTLLAVITATALLLWGIPEWREYKRRMNFELYARQLTAVSPPALLPTLPPQSTDRPTQSTDYSDVDGNRVVIVYRYYQRYWYCIYIQHGERSGGFALGMGRPPRADWKCVRVYRLHPAPDEYRAQTENVVREVKRRQSDSAMSPLPTETQYRWDFEQIITGRELRDIGIKYQLIHADPPIILD